GLMNVPGETGAQLWVMQDFRDAIYFPVRGWLDGMNPYDPDAYLSAYPVGQTFPVYSPELLILHAPLGLLSLTAANISYLVLNVVLVPVLAWFVLRLTGPATLDRTILLSGALLLTRPLQFDLLLGQPTLLLVLGTYVALFWRRSPWSAGLG